MKIVVLLVTFISLNAYGYMDSGEKGNGGLVVRCNGKLRLADFLEAEVLPGLKKNMTVQYIDDVSYLDQAQNAIDRLAKIIESFGGNSTRLRELYRNLENINWLDGRYLWMETRDFGRLARAKGCGRPMNVIHYFDHKYIDGQLELFNELSETEKAGLLVHEVVYALTRELSKESTSLPARRITALLFSRVDDESLLKNLVLRFATVHKHLYRVIDTSRIGDGDVTIYLSEQPYDRHKYKLSASYNKKKIEFKGESSKRASSMPRSSFPGIFKFEMVVKYGKRTRYMSNPFFVVSSVDEGLYLVFEGESIFILIDRSKMEALLYGF